MHLVVKYIFICVLSFLKFNDSYANYSKSVGKASATIVESTLNIQNSDSNLTLAFNSNTNTDSAKAVSEIYSVPNTSMKVYYTDTNLSEQDNNYTENKEVILRNENNDTLKAELRIDKSNISFNKDGKGELNINSKFLVDKESPGGNYEGVYQIVMFY